MNYTIGIDTSVNLYTFDYINCFEKPICLILGNEDDTFQSFLNIYLKMFQSYNFSSFNDSDIFYTEDFNNALDYIIREKLGFEIMITESDGNNLHSIIRECLDKGHPIMVPGNLRELSYTEYYQSRNWKHLFLITGYDDLNQTYTVIDTNHQKVAANLRYGEFTFSYSLLERLYLSVKEKLNVSNIWSIYRINGKEYPKEIDLLSDVFDWFVKCRSDSPYKEIEYINRINREIETPVIEETDITKQIDFIFLRAVKYKDVFYRELLCILEKYPVHREQLNKLIELKDCLIIKWTDIANKALVKHYLKESFAFNEEVEQVLHLEEEIRKVAGKIMDQLKTNYIED